MAAEEHGSLRSRASSPVGVNRTPGCPEPALRHGWSRVVRRGTFKVFVFMAYFKSGDLQLAPPYYAQMMAVGQDG